MEENIVQPQPPVEIPPNPTKLWLKIVFFAVLGLILVGGLVFAGVQISKNQGQFASPRLWPITPGITIVPTFKPLPTLKPFPTVKEQNTPEAVVQNFYSWYLNYPSGPTKGNVLSSGAYKTSEYVSNKLIQKVENIIASFNGGGGYDPILCAQDIPNGFTVGKAEISKDQAAITFTEEWSAQQPTNIKVELRLINNQWKITNITCPIP